MAFALASELIELGKPVFGICRGLQEINVLFGGTLRRDLGEGHQHPSSDVLEFEEWFDHRHSVRLLPGGLLGKDDEHDVIEEPPFTVKESRA